MKVHNRSPTEKALHKNEQCRHTFEITHKRCAPCSGYGNVKLPAMHYTPDFVLTYADGTVEVVEVKSKFTRRQQRDYIHRRRMFIDLVAEPRGWRFVEHITPDTAAEIKAWKKCAQQTERKG